MKPSSITHGKVLATAAMALASLLALPQTAAAKGRDKQPKSHQYDQARQRYSSHPRSSFTLTLGTGYAGRGYYYGPPNSAYYYERPDVRYYATRNAAPREYYSHSGYSRNSTAAAVQQELARRGYYGGSIDGQIGPQSRRAIARYQQQQGLRVTATINTSLLRSLRLQ